jgi:hypothetical protein
MTLPLTTRTVTIETPDVTDDDPLDTVDTYSTVGTYPAHIGDASMQREGAGREQADAVLFLNPDATVTRLDRVTDNATSLRYMALWTQPYVGVGLDHTKVGLRRIRGDA